jgi:hypothetical protein
VRASTALACTYESVAEPASSAISRGHRRQQMLEQSFMRRTGA